MPGQRHPIELVLAKGNKHLTKAENESRRNSESGPLKVCQNCKDWVNGEQCEKDFEKTLLN